MEEKEIETKEEKKLGEKEIETIAKNEKPNTKESKAIVRGLDLAISTKHAIAICDFIRGKEPKEAIMLLEKVIKKEIAVPMKGEIPHRRRGQRVKGKVAGRFPTKASRVFIKLLKNLIANANVKGLDTESLIISLAKADKASRPHRAARIAFGRKRFKRSHVLIEAKTKSFGGKKK